MDLPRTPSASASDEEKHSVEKGSISHSEVVLPVSRSASAKPRLPIGFRILILVLTCLCSCECYFLSVPDRHLMDFDSRKSLE